MKFFDKKENCTRKFDSELRIRFRPIQARPFRTITAGTPQQQPSCHSLSHNNHPKFSHNRRRRNRPQRLFLANQSVQTVLGSGLIIQWRYSIGR